MATSIGAGQDLKAAAAAAAAASAAASSAQTTANSAQGTANSLNNSLYGGTIAGGHSTWDGGSAGISLINGAFLNATGTKNFYIVDPADPTKHITYSSVESPKVTLQDFGVGTLVGGTVTITVDPTFSRVTDTGDTLKVVATPMGDCKGLFIASVAGDRSSFVVQECQGGTSNVSFNWMAWATRDGYVGRPVVT